MKTAVFMRLAALLLCAALLAGCGGALSTSSVQPQASWARSSSSAAQQQEPLASSVSSASTASAASALKALPEGFAYVAEAAPDVLLEIRYYSSYNFVGERIDGYEAPVAILCIEAATALNTVALQLKSQGYLLKVFDAYRPTTAVEHFARWAQDPVADSMKPYFYPEVDKRRLFELGYLSTRSGHSRGATVDLTLVDMSTGKELDMGTPFDFFGQASHFGSALITSEQAANREILKAAMEAGEFESYTYEWWHYALAGEPYPDTYFDFPVR